MARLVVNSFTISLDGYGAGPHQSKETPLGVGGEELHDWLVTSRTFQRMQGREGGDTGIDEGWLMKCTWLFRQDCSGPVSTCLADLVDDVLVLVFGDAAVVTGRTHGIGNFAGTPYDVIIRFTDTFVRREGQWTAVASHASVVTSSQPRDRM